MSKTLIGIVTFGNLPFTQLTINSIKETTKHQFDFFVVVGKPGDGQTSDWLIARDITHSIHYCNNGFPYSLNEIYDHAFTGGDYDNLICVGNDVVAYPRAVDALIDVADTTDWEWCCSSQFDVASLCSRYPEAKKCFTQPNFQFNDWTKTDWHGVIDYTPNVRPWDLHAHTIPPSKPEGIQPDCIKDVRNLCLFKRSVFEKIGYADANYWPGGYFEDNDYCTRARLAGIKACVVAHSAYFHFWSRTIHQGGGGSTNNTLFDRNCKHYVMKWGGGFDHEKWKVPFDGKQLQLREGLVLPADLKISSRANDAAIVDYWKSKP